LKYGAGPVYLEEVDPEISVEMLIFTFCRVITLPLFDVGDLKKRQLIRRAIA
jgi:hypothetical protein